jgi:transposase
MSFNAHGPGGLIDRKAPGQPSRLNDTHRAALAAVIESGSTPAIHGVVRWRIVDLCQWLRDQFGVTIAEQTLSRELRAMNYRKLSARSRHHAQAEGAIDAFKKVSPPSWKRLLGRRASIPAIRGVVRRWLSAEGDQPGRSEEQDHQVVRQALHPAVRSQGPADRIDLYLRRHLPPGGQGLRPVSAVVRHSGDDLHLAAISAKVAAGRHAVPLVDQAGWHHSERLVVPPKITIVPPPDNCPELNPQENAWQFMRDNWLSEPRVRRLRQSGRSLLRRLEQAH